MKLCRFTHGDETPRIGLVLEDGLITDLTEAGFTSLTSLLEAEDGQEQVTEAVRGKLSQVGSDQVRWLSPAEGQEVWAAGVTYSRSRTETTLPGMRNGKRRYPTLWL